MDSSGQSRKVWESSFNETTREEQMKEDSSAWNAVTGLLLAIISIGVVLALFTVWMSL